MRTFSRAPFYLALILCSVGFLSLTVHGRAQTITNLCVPSVSNEVTVATAAQREAAGNIAIPPITDHANGFAWPDTPLGIIRSDGGYAFFGSDGALHSSQDWEGRREGNNKYGSITRSLGTLDRPLGTEPPVDVTVKPNPDPAVNPFYPSYDYMGGGPVQRVPKGQPGAGSLLMVYHAEIPIITTQSFYSVLGLARSTDEGLSWIDLGEIIRINQGYRSDMDGYDIGVSNLVPSPDGKYFYIFFADWLANGTTHWGSTINLISLARAPVDSVYAAAFNDNIRMHSLSKSATTAGILPRDLAAIPATCVPTRPTGVRSGWHGMPTSSATRPSSTMGIYWPTPSPPTASVGLFPLS